MEKKIVIVDDSQTFLMYVGLLLKRMNYKVIQACDGVECLKVLKLTEPDAILLDLHMSPVDGLKILQHVKNDPQTASIPVIMVSNDANPDSVKKCTDLGAYDYLTKPVKIAARNGNTVQRP
jgi:CheY-like chemotaxis protein